MRISPLPHIIIGLLVLSACTLPGQKEKEIDDPQMIGGQRDEHGCLGPAGYLYDEEVGACIRVWELDENGKKAAGIAVAEIGSAKGLTVISVEPIFCMGCFTIDLQNDEQSTQVLLENWEIVL